MSIRLNRWTLTKLRPAAGRNFNPNRKYAANSLFVPGLSGPITGCPAPRKIIADTGDAVDLIGARD